MGNVIREFWIFQSRSPDDEPFMLKSASPLVKILFGWIDLQLAAWPVDPWKFMLICATVEPFKSLDDWLAGALRF